MAMFKTQIKIIGKHAAILQKYCMDKGSQQDQQFNIVDINGEKKQIYLFDTRISCYMVSAMLGLLYDRTSEIDNSKTTNVVANIFLEALDKKRSKLMRIYQHMVLSKDLSLSPDMRIKKAFSHLSDEECTYEQNRLEDYVRGGLEVLDECFSSCHTYEDICNSFHDLMDKIIDFLNCKSTN